MWSNSLPKVKVGEEVIEFPDDAVRDEMAEAIRKRAFRNKATAAGWTEIRPGVWSDFAPKPEPKIEGEARAQPIPKPNPDLDKGQRLSGDLIRNTK
jgi:hypothetical protein